MYDRLVETLPLGRTYISLLNDMQRTTIGPTTLDHFIGHVITDEIRVRTDGALKYLTSNFKNYRINFVLRNRLFDPAERDWIVDLQTPEYNLRAEMNMWFKSDNYTQEVYELIHYIFQTLHDHQVKLSKEKQYQD